MIKDITSDTFQAEVLAASYERPIAVDFWAPWCGPCRMMQPLLDQVAVATAGIGRVVKVNVDEQPSLATGFGIQSMPTLLFFKDGQVYDRVLGVTSKELILTRILEEAAVPTDQQLAAAV